MDFEFSKTSKKRLRTCHKDLQLIMECAIAFSKVDFGIAEGHRSIELQHLADSSHDDLLPETRWK